MVRNCIMPHVLNCRCLGGHQRSKGITPTHNLKHFQAGSKPKARWWVQWYELKIFVGWEFGEWFTWKHLVCKPKMIIFTERCNNTIKYTAWTQWCMLIFKIYSKADVSVWGFMRMPHHVQHHLLLSITPWQSGKHMQDISNPKAQIKQLSWQGWESMGGFFGLPETWDGGKLGLPGKEASSLQRSVKPLI